MARSSSVDLIAREVFIASLLENGRHLESAMKYLARKMDDVNLSAGETLYRRGERSDHFFFVQSGEIELIADGLAPYTFHQRDLVGTLDATLGRPHARDAVAKERSHLLRLRLSDWTELLEDDFEMARRAVTRMSKMVMALHLRPPPLGGFAEPGDSTELVTDGLHVVDRILRLREVPAFRRASTQALAVLARIGSTRMAKKGEALFASGEMKGQLVIVASGEVSASWSDSSVTARFGPGSLVGGAGAICAPPPSEVHATTADVRALVLPTEDYFDVMEEHFDVAQSALIALAEERDQLQETNIATAHEPSSTEQRVEGAS